MFVDAQDLDPASHPSSRLRPAEMSAGLAVAALSHVFVVGGAWAAGSALEALFDEPAIQEHEVLEARFVKLGKPLDPRKLPNRRVPRLSTSPPDRVAVSKDPRQRDRPDAGPPPEDATEDLLTRLGDRAQAFAEIADQREQEGDPEGIEEGTAEQAQAGNLYAGKLYAFFRRGWTLPTLLSDQEKRSLVVEVDVEVDPKTLHVTDFRLRNSSGNALFDQSVLDRLDQLRRENVPLPEPPEALRREYFSAPLGLRFRGRDAS